MVKRYVVHHLSCSGCAGRIEDAFLSLPGVGSAAIDLSSRRLRLEGKGGAAILPDLATLIQTADAIEPGASFSELQEDLSTCNLEITSDKEPSLWRSERDVWIAAVLFATGLLFGDRLAVWLTSTGVDVLFYGIPYLLCGIPILRQGARAIRRFDVFNEYTLMGGATLAAIAIDQLPEAVGVMLFYRLGEAVQERAAGRSRRSIKALLAARPSIAHVLAEDGSIHDAAPESLQIGMVFQVRPGEKIPLDGIVRKGESQVDTSPLTGEPIPVRISEGSQVFSGTVNLLGVLTVESTALFENSSVARILEIVERAAANKAPVERFITRFARYYTPAVVLGAVLVAILPPLFGMGTYSEWLYRALVLLVISCPCALVISIPLGYFGGIGAASRRGILVKGGHVLDALRNITTVAFDKTGTLTRGVFEVTRLLPAPAPVPGVTETELLFTAALPESQSNHPVARSILRAAVDRGFSLSGDTVAIHEVAGKGLIADVQTGGESHSVLVGNEALLDEYHIVPSVDIPEDTGGSIVHVARDGVYLGAILVSDVIRPESATAVAELHSLGIQKVMMLTGDRVESASAVARELHLDDFRAALLPEDKANVLASLNPAQTLFVGDGINDAPVLALSGVGVAMGGLGSEAAVEVADAVILDDSPSRLPELLRIAAHTRTIVWQNITLALSIKLIFISLGIVGLSGLWEAVFADVGVALLAVLNASRAMRG